MPTAATTAGHPAQTPARNAGGNAQQAVLPVVPFVRASFENRQDMGFQQSRVLTANQQSLGVNDVPAYGYLRNIVLQVVATGAGAGAAAGGVAGVLSENGPWNVLQGLSLSEPNGAPIFQVTDGFSAYLINKWGGYKNGLRDPKAGPAFTQDANGNFTFLIRVPIELNAREALGALPNQNDTSSFKLRLSLAAATLLYQTAPTVMPTVAVSAFLECWDQPSTDAAGQVNQVTPPAMNTTQFWSESFHNQNAGLQTIKLDRLGNYLRSLIFICNRAGGSRLNGDGDWPDPITFFLDGRPMDFLPKIVWKNQMFERGALLQGAAPDAALALNNGVFVYDFMHDFDGQYGYELRNGWLGTIGSERLEFKGSFANSCQVTVLTNDVAIAGSVWS